MTRGNKKIYDLVVVSCSYLALISHADVIDEMVSHRSMYIHGFTPDTLDVSHISESLASIDVSR